MNWIIKPFDALTTAELYKIIQARIDVFVVEQDCPYQDADNKDFRAMHLWLPDEEGNIKAYCRLLPSGISYPEPSIGRVLTGATSRKEGLGRKMMEKAIEFIQQTWQSPNIRISAQLYLKDFYGSLGFQQIGVPYPEDNIPHIEMFLSA
jgi:ElaA protein